MCKLLYKSTGTSFSVLKSYNKIAKTGKEKAELINKRFVSCFLSTCGTKNKYSSLISEDLLYSEDFVFHLLSILDVSKSCGSDNISAYMFKYTAKNICSSVTSLFNLSLKMRQVPSQWKEACVSPIPKQSNPVSPDHYRPISLLCILIKIMKVLDLGTPQSLLSFLQSPCGILNLSLIKISVVSSLIIEKHSTWCPTILSWKSLFHGALSQTYLNVNYLLNVW